MTEGTVQSWTVEIGDSFSAGDIICQIETDKAAVDFEATDDGFMAKHLVEPGHAPIATGSPIAVTVMEEEDIEANDSDDSVASRGRGTATVSDRKRHKKGQMNFGEVAVQAPGRGYGRNSAAPQKSA